MVNYVIGIDQNIIKIKYHIDIKEVRKDVIHEALKGSKNISEIK